MRYLGLVIACCDVSRAARLRREERPARVLRYFFGYECRLRWWLSCCCLFAVGMGIGRARRAGQYYRQRREIASLKKELRLKHSWLMPVSIKNSHAFF